MNDERQKRIFAKNLNYYISKSGKQQKDIAKILGFEEKSFSTWCTGRAIPKVSKIQVIADYFGVGMTDLIDEHDHAAEEAAYYIDEETRKTAQAIKDNKELSLLFDAAKDAKSEDLKQIHDLLLFLKSKEKGQ